MTLSSLEFDGDSHESSAHWFGMTVLFDALLSSANSNFPNCCVQPISTTFFLSIPHLLIFFRDGITKQACRQ